MQSRNLLAALAASTLAFGTAWAEDTSKKTGDAVEATAEAAAEDKDTVTVAETEIAPDIEAGETLYRKECRACHGPTGKGVSSYPKLVGHPADYLAGKLELYRAGEKLGPNTMLMAPRAKKLADEDIANLAGFLASLPAE